MKKSARKVYRLPFFSTNPSDANLVILKMKEDGYDFKHNQVEKTHIVSFIKDGTSTEAKSSTREISICIAALKAKDVDVSEWEK